MCRVHSTSYDKGSSFAMTSRYNLTTCHGALPPEGAEFRTRKAPSVLAARLNGRDTNKPDAWSVLVPPHQARPKLQPSNATPHG